MLTNSWSISLLICSVVSLFLIINGVKTGWRIVHHWNLGSGSELQIRLEEEVILSAVLVEFGCIVQVLSVLLLVLAADHFSTLLVGAMCATGALTANSFGIPALLVKLLSLFISLSWIVLHNLDIRSEFYPLVKGKYFLLFLILPLLLLDSTLVVLYLYNLDPDIITSCCGIVLSTQSRDGYNLLSFDSSLSTFGIYIVITTLVVITSGSLSRKKPFFSNGQIHGGTVLGLWMSYYFSSLVVITILVSPYVYAMPHHRCPFDLIKEPYLSAGISLYLFLHAATGAGVSSGLAALVETTNGLEQSAAKLRIYGGRASLVCLSIFLLFTLYYPLIYHLRGGE